MKNLKKFIAIAFIAILGSSCNSDDDNPIVIPTNNTIVGVASRNPNLSILVQALAKVDLAGTLQGAGPFTVFAPTNTAFAAFLEANGFDSLNDVPEDVLTQVLLNHVVSGKNLSTSLTNSYVKTLAKGTASTVNTLSMYIDVTSGVKLNGVASVSTADVAATNGVIHIVDAVIGLPTIVTHALANPAFSTLVTTVTNPSQSAILTALNGDGPLTVFAPTNGGFDMLNTYVINTVGIPGGIGALDAATISNVLLYHVVGGNNLASSLVAGNLETILGQTFEVQLTTPEPKIKDANNRLSTIKITDVQCTNGVIHAIDNALLQSLN